MGVMAMGILDFLNTLVTIIVVIGYGTYFIKKLIKFIMEHRK